VSPKAVSLLLKKKKKKKKKLARLVFLGWFAYGIWVKNDLEVIKN